MKSIPPERKIELLGQLLSAEDGSRGASADRLKDIIEKDLPAALRAPLPPDIIGLYAEQQKTLVEFRSFLERGPVIGKRVVAIGGSFSSGKSTFLNMLLGGPSLLPTDLLRTTAVPSYLVNGADEHGEGINLLGSAVRLAPDDIASLAHSADGSAELPLGSILSCIFIFTPRMPYSHIALLDTPGYSDAGSAGASGHTDRDIAYRQLCGSDAILWFVPADHGTLQQDDITFLKSLPPDIPKAVVVSKADKPQDRSELDDVVRAVRSALDRGGIRCGHIFVLSRRKGAPSELEEIRSYIKKMDSAAETPDFAVRFRKIFRSCRDFYDRRISEGKQRLRSLNRPLTLADDGSEAVQCLQGIAAETKKEIRSCEDAMSRIESVRQSFFTELKCIGDQAGISMPDPGEIDRSEANSLGSIFESIFGDSLFKRTQNAADQGYSTAASRLAELKGEDGSSMPSAAGNAKPQQAGWQDEADPLLKRGLEAYSRGDYTGAAELFRKAAGNGNATALSRLGDMFYDGTGVGQSFSDAVLWYWRAAEQGNAQAQFRLGVMYEQGQGVRKNEGKALIWLRKAADQGDADARSKMGLVSEPSDTESEPFAKPEEKTKADDGGKNPGGNAQKGQSAGVSSSNAEQSKPQPAARQDEADPLLKRGLEAYSRGDYTGAAELFRKAAGNGNASALSRLGDMFYDGTGVGQSFSDAVLWYWRAAEQGNAHAQFRLGVMYEQGQGVRKNEGKALIWLRKAADQGNDDARSRLSCIEGNGSAPIQKNRPVSSASGFFGSLFGF